VSGSDLDLRSDVFALGALLYEMLSGRKAFPAATRPGLRMEILNHAVAPLERVPEGTARLVARCLEKRREDRWQRMELLLAELKLQYLLAR